MPYKINRILGGIKAASVPDDDATKPAENESEYFEFIILGTAIWDMTDVAAVLDPIVPKPALAKR